jgi:hypothetical protein
VKPLVDEFTTKITRSARSFMLVYPSGLDLSSSHLRFLTTLIRNRRRAIGSRWRRLNAGRQALLSLAHLRNRHPYAQLAAGFSIGTTTAYRYIPEASRPPGSPGTHTRTSHP